MSKTYEVIVSPEIDPHAITAALRVAGIGGEVRTADHSFVRGAAYTDGKADERKRWVAALSNFVTCADETKGDMIRRMRDLAKTLVIRHDGI